MSTPHTHHALGRPTKVCLLKHRTSAETSHFVACGRSAYLGLYALSYQGIGTLNATKLRAYKHDELFFAKDATILSKGPNLRSAWASPFLKSVVHPVCLCMAQVTKKSFTEVVTLLDQAKRPTRLTFVRHACGRRFVGREKGGGGSCRCASSAAGRRVPPLGSVLAIGLAGCCGKWGMPRCGCEQPKRSSSIGQPALSPSPQKQNTRYRQTEVRVLECERSEDGFASVKYSRKMKKSGCRSGCHRIFLGEVVLPHAGIATLIFLPEGELWLGVGP